MATSQDVINAAYLRTLGRPADPVGLAFYSSQLEAGRSVGDILADLNYAAATTQSDADIERQVKEDVAKFMEARDAEQSTAGIGALLNTSQFTPQITPGIAADLIGRSQTGGVLTSEFDQYGGYDAVKNVYDASGGAGAGAGAGAVETINLSTRTTPPNVDTTNLFTSTGDTRAVTGPPVPDYGYINDLYKTYFGRDASAQELASYAGIFGPTIEPNEIKDFILGGVTSKEITQDQADILLGLKPDPVKIAAETEAANAEGRPGAGQILGIPTFARQTPSDLTFAPLRRGLGQLRPAMSMTGLTSGQAAFGGVAPTPVQPSSNVVSSPPATPYALPEDFILQTGAYGTPTPTFFTPTPAKTTSPSESSKANANQPGSTGGGGGGGGGFESNPTPSSSSFSDIGAAIADAVGLGSDSSLSDGFTGSVGPEGGNPSPGDEGAGMGFGGMDSPGPSETGGDGVDYEVGGMIKMVEGGEPPTPPPMSKLSAKEAGSTFDIADYIDDQGRLVGGYSKPIYDENRVITGYDYRPYERDVVFGELRDKEAAMRLTDAEREQMMVEMAMRQGRTGISPTTGGLAGIQIGDPEKLMRRQPQYYSTVEQFRPRYAEGGNVSSTAQDLASRGRGGDTMLVHMAPHEVTGLNALARMQGTELTINPETGMPEALKLGKLFKTLAPFIPFIPGVGQFLAPAFGALGMGGFSPLLQKAITSGVVGGFTGPKGGFDLQRGLMQGITAYGLGSLQQNLGGPSTPGGPPTSTGTGSLSGSPAGVTSASVPIQGTEKEFLAARPEFDRATFDALRSDVMAHPDFSGNIPAPLSISPEVATQSQSAARDAVAYNPLSDPEVGGTSNLGAPFEYEPVSPKNAATTASGMKTPAALLTAGFGASNVADYDKLTSAGIAVKREKEEEDELYRRLFERSLGAVPVRSGGLMKLAGGGMSYMEAGGTTGPTGAPRDVVGTGDGMSDSVPADIEGVQEARLADGEFVIPADVVADIGNGSSDAGSKKLYDMMDRVRMARHDTKEQPPEIKAERLMPA
jgi:hypothetical protein